MHIAHSTPSRPNIVVVVADSLKKTNATGPDGGIAGLPHLTGQGIEFRRAVAAAPWTAPATASVFTGLPAHEHALDGSGKRNLHGDIPTLAQRLKSLGYSTHQITANVATTDIFGLHRGFDSVHPIWKEVPDRGLKVMLIGRLLTALSKKSIQEPLLELLNDPWAVVTRLANGERIAGLSLETLIGDEGAARMGSDFASGKSWFQSMAQDEFALANRILARDPSTPKFVFVNLMETHYPYHIAGAFEFATPGGFFNPVSYLRELPGLVHMAKQTHIVDASHRFAPGIPDLLKARQRGAWERIAPMVDGFARDVDAHGDNAFAFLADHGENFGDDEGWFYHFANVTPSGTDVPFVFRPNIAERGARAVFEPVSTRFLFHTLLAAAGSTEPEIEALNISRRDPADLTPPEIATRWYNHSKDRKTGKSNTRPELQYNQYSFVWEDIRFVYRKGGWLMHVTVNADGGFLLEPVQGDPIEDLPLQPAQRETLRESFKKYLCFSEKVGEGWR